MNWFEDSVGFQIFKIEITEWAGLSKDAMHVHVGLVIFILVRLCWRWRGGWILAWCAALSATLLGEYLDLKGEEIRAQLTPDSAHWHDIWNTMMWPTILMIIGRWLTPHAKPNGNNETPELSDLADQPFNQTCE